MKKRGEPVRWFSIPRQIQSHDDPIRMSAHTGPYYFATTTAVIVAEIAEPSVDAADSAETGAC